MDLPLFESNKRKPPVFWTRIYGVPPICVLEIGADVTDFNRLVKYLSYGKLHGFTCIVQAA
tara:strand:+ start:225 stop:407 length:183 start_codon:yes stop_codon:yes gene_type:complete